MSNIDGTVDLADVSYFLRWLYLGGVEDRALPGCADVNEGIPWGNCSDLGLSDAVVLWDWLFQRDFTLPAPGPGSGPDAKPDCNDGSELDGCESYTPRRRQNLQTSRSGSKPRETMSGFPAGRLRVKSSRP